MPTMDWIHEIRQHRGLIRLLDITVLGHLLRQRIADPSLRARLATELTIRGWLLAGGAPWIDLPERSAIQQSWASYDLSSAAQASLEAWLDRQFPNRVYAPPDISAVPSPFCSMLRKELENWHCADGAFPVVSKNCGNHLAPCTLLPFIVDRTDSPHGAGVRTATGEGLPHLNEGVDQALRVLRRRGRYEEREFIRVTLINLANPGQIISGRSLGLPVLIAEHMKQMSQRPQCLALCSSGCLADNGQLDRDISARESFDLKAEWMKRCGVATCILPEGGALKVGVTIWPLAQPLDDLLCALVRVPHKDRGKSPGAIEIRLKNHDKGMRYGRVRPADALSELEEISIDLADRRDAKSRRLRLYCDVLKAAALCHMGRTKESVIVTNTAVHQAREIGPYYEIEALVRQAVNSTDFADYESAVLLCDKGIGRLPFLNILDERMDLELKATSTKAQALTYWSLIDDSYLEESLRLTLKSVDLAKELDGDYPDNPERNLPRNLTYLYGWHALHKPLESETMRQEIVDGVCGDPHSGVFFIRNRWLAAYRAYLCGHSLDWEMFENDLPNSATGWLWSLCLKYRGALRAASGKADAANEDFTRAVRLLNHVDSTPLLAFIGATAALQAAESLIDSLPEQALHYAASALPVFNSFNGWFAMEKVDAARWRERAEAILSRQSLEGVANPQLSYLY